MRRLAPLAALVLLASACDREKLASQLDKVSAKLHKAPAAPPAPATPPPPPEPVAAAPKPPDDGLQHIAITLHGPMEREVAAQVAPGVAPALALVMQRITLWWMAPADARNGDAIQAVYELPAGKEPLVRALRYTSQKFGKTFAAYYFQPAGSSYGRYYTADGQELEERLQDSPVETYEQVTSFLKDGRHHQGVDFKCAVGTPVVMPFDGTLVRKNWNWHGNGNCLEFVDSRSGRHAKFLHLSPLPASLHPGERFHTGQQVALTGNTGHTTAPHLHYQLESGSGSILDPFQVHPTFRAKLPAEQQSAFHAAMAKLDASLDRKD